MDRRAIATGKPRQFVYKNHAAVDSLKPLKLKLRGEQWCRLDSVLVFTDADHGTVLSLSGPDGSLNIRLEAKAVAGLACMLTKQLIDPARPQSMQRKPLG